MEDMKGNKTMKKTKTLKQRKMETNKAVSKA